MAKSGKPSRPSGYGEARASTKKKAPRTPEAYEREVGSATKLLAESGVDQDVLDEVDENFQNNKDRFQKEFKKLRKRTGAANEHFNAEAVNRMMLRAMLTMVLDVIPIAEEAYRKTKKENAAYALNALLNQARELSLDLKLAKDTTGQVEFIERHVLTPVFTSFAQLLIQEMYALKATIDTEVPAKAGKRVKSKVDDMVRSLGQFQSGMIEKISSDIHGYLSGTMKLDGVKSKR